MKTLSLLVMFVGIALGFQLGMFTSEYKHSRHLVVYDFKQVPIDSTHTYADGRNAYPYYDFHTWVMDTSGHTVGMVLTKPR